MKKDKERKGHESTIGKIIYGFMLFAPLLAVLSAVLVNTFNVKKETETQVNINYKYETNDVDSIDDLKVGNIYTLYIDENNENIQSLLHSSDSYFDFTIIKVHQITRFNDVDLEESMNYLTLNENDNVFVNIFCNVDYLLVNVYGSNYQIYDEDYLVSYTFSDFANEDYQLDVFEFDIIFNDFNDIQFTDDVYISKCENIQIESVDIETTDYNPTNTFYKAINDVEESNLFNWAKNSIIYTGIQATCETLSINNTFIPMLLSYWLIMSILYFLYDIILMILQILHKKIHELQDSF